MYFTGCASAQLFAHLKTMAKIIGLLNHILCFEG
jgi:hypothetical protein